MCPFNLQRHSHPQSELTLVDILFLFNIKDAQSREEERPPTLLKHLRLGPPHHSEVLPDAQPSYSHIPPRPDSLSGPHCPLTSPQPDLSLGMPLTNTVSSPGIVFDSMISTALS